MSGLVSGIGSLVGGIIGANNSAGASGNALNDANISNQILQEIGAAPDVSAPLILQKYQQAGVLTPEMQNAIIAQLPANIQTNPQIQSAQMQALQQMQQRANTGLTQSDRATMNQMQQQAQTATQGQLAAIQQNMQQQGLSDSGTALASKLAAAQNGSNQLASNANQVAQQSQQAQQQALSNLGQYGSQLEGQQFNQAFQQQQAQQAMQRFNIQNQMAVQQQNTQSANQAQAANLANAQNVSNQNVGAQNQELYNQQQQAMNQYNANKNTSEVQAGGYGSLAGVNQNLANTQAQAGYNLGSGLGQIAGGALSAAGVGGSSPSALEQAQTNYYNNAANSFGGSGSSGSNSSNPYSSALGNYNFASGGPVHDYRGGGMINARTPHEKARVPGDSPANDNIHAMVSEGEIVVPRTLSQSPFGKHILKIIEAHNNLKKHMNGEK